MSLDSRFLIVLPGAVALIAAACGGTIISEGTGGGGLGAGTTGSSTGSSTGIPTSSSTSGSTSTSGGVHIEPPPPPPLTGPPGVGSTVLAVTKLYLGDTDRDGTPDKLNGWKQYGFDLDGKISTATSTDLCKTVDGASPINVYPDGEGGIDNNFGKLILPMLLGLSTNTSSQINMRISSGAYTYLLDLQGLGAGTDQNPVPAKMYTGANLGHPPLFDGSDVWPVDPSSLFSATDITSARTQFFAGYLISSTWVGAPTTTVYLQLGFANVALPLQIGHAIVSMTLDPIHQSATNGTVAGVIPVTSLVVAIQEIAGQIDPSLCAGPTIESILNQIAQAADILQDGTQDPTRPCDGISIGLGFDAHVVQLGSIAPATPPPPNPCGG